MVSRVAPADPAPKPAESQGPLALRARILLAEDDPAVRCMMREFLGSRGFDVEEAASCGETEAAFTRTVPDAVLVDYQLPDGNALDLLRRLQPQAPDVPI
ncbi:MAG TPA: response regulator, partial [Candidatus Udaeobacter sp.]|nr:response regulator [Candidatus Udaeobacter sp.]